ncbi:ribosome maturation factor RimP [Dethiosulfovibrio salsuginis]|uniref:Ribosome maturation factor RimP n=1 Tax=Dethiosulfovibrio salsuginis TaxID=561720 RepID=A0A1X7I5D0_9BACT|nr:ribosome maturation factor RimP [Dethiosulfovibrio salsuginis]SMG09458.1 ribosome maturation factor RimP [Dethiosulfovibrio salsuginis]
MEGQHFSHEEIRSIVEALGYEFVGFEIKKESGSPFFRVYIDSLGGISVRDCEIVARKINKTLEERGQDLLEERYYLEVSSPGLERPLCTVDDFRRFEGQTASLRFRELLEGRRRVTGKIDSVEGDTVIVLSDEGPLEVPISLLLSAKLVYKPDKQPKKGGSQRQKKSKKNDLKEER